MNERDSRQTGNNMRENRMTFENMTRGLSGELLSFKVLKLNTGNEG